MNRNNKIKAVIFDLDDTLVSEYEFIVSGYRYMAEKLSDRFSLSPEEINRELWELTKEKYEFMFNRLFDRHRVPYTADEMREIVTEYRNHPAGLQFYPDAYPTLCALKDRGILMGIISDGDPERQRNKIGTAIAGLPAEETRRSEKDWFDEIILNDEFGGASYRKPNPHGFEVMAERLGIEPSEMIYIGDNPAKDFNIAKKLPIRTARIIREKGIYSDKEYLDGIEETWRLKSLTDLINIVDITITSGTLMQGDK